ncbi:hypothetical protein GQ42DRAFT_160973 [Ramicandelaber brevisporus]|nr:hypothetical protein GQ42DRAFT_160973 [Ramicandelaber brevisporus]
MPRSTSYRRLDDTAPEDSLSSADAARVDPLSGSNTTTIFINSDVEDSEDDDESDGDDDYSSSKSRTGQKRNDGYSIVMEDPADPSTGVAAGLDGLPGGGGSGTTTSTTTTAAGIGRQPQRSRFFGFFSRSRDTRGPSQAVDGVFANMAAKPITAAEANAIQPELPPSYSDVAGNESVANERTTSSVLPSYFEVSPNVTMDEDNDEVLIDGMYVGSPLHYIVNMLIAGILSIPGFIIAYMFSASHSARCGAYSGLGVTVGHYGFVMLMRGRTLALNGGGPTSTIPDELLGHSPNDPSSDDGPIIPFIDLPPVALQIAGVVTIVMGVGISMWASLKYYRIIRLRQIITSTSS